ncbi:hypothetical protein FRB90_010362 [Tulasnella sp. 427]|nr:hypothetical protein FRB90_010362 [Tulasnella sp. 427]
MYGPPGTSHLSQTKVYTEQPTEQSSTNAAYFISCDGQRIYGKDFYSCLSDHINDEDGTEHGSTLTLLFDMCDAATFFDDVISLSSSMAQPSNDFVDSQRSEHSRSRRQLVVIYAAQKDQTAGTVNLDHRAGHRYLVGAATYLITGRLQTHPSASATDVFEYVNECCNGRKEEHLRQNPSIVSRYPISGPLRLLPSSTVGTIARIPADRNTSAPGLYPTLKSPIFGYSRLIRPHRIPFFGTLN